MISLIVLLASIQALYACPYSRSLRGEEIEGAEFPQVLAAPVCLKSPGKVTASSAGYIAAYNTAKAAYLAEFGALVVVPEPPPGVLEVVPVAQRAQLFKQANMAGNTLRATFHDAGEFDRRTLDLNGPDGCLSNSDPNRGMVEPTAFVVSFLEPLWQKMCDKISRADFWAMMGKIAAEASDPTGILNLPLRFGRKDSASCDSGINRLPDHQIGIAEYQRVFADQMGLTVAEGIALTGAHTVGHVHTEHSGFGIVATLAELINAPHANAWDETSNLFDNQYYVSLIGEPWINVQMNKARPNKNHWGVAEGLGPLAPGAVIEPGFVVLPGGLGGFLPHPPTQMLNADMHIAFPIDVSVDPILKTAMGIQTEYCAIAAIDGQYGCKTPSVRKVGWPVNTYDQALKYTGGTLELALPLPPFVGPPELALVFTPEGEAAGNLLFFQDFSRAYLKMTSVGYGVSGNKLGPNLTKLPICQYSGFCRGNADCQPGNKCNNPTNPFFSQCVPATYPTPTTCLKNFGTKCSATTKCCDPGAFCDLKAAFPQCRQPTAGDGTCVHPRSFETGL